MKIPDRGIQGALHIRMYRDRHKVAMHWLDTKGVSFLSISTNYNQRFELDVSRNCGREQRVIPTSPVQQEYLQYMRGVDTQAGATPPKFSQRSGGTESTSSSWTLPSPKLS